MLKDTNANKIFLIILVLILALSFSLYKMGEAGGDRATQGPADRLPGRRLPQGIYHQQ